MLVGDGAYTSVGNCRRRELRVIQGCGDRVTRSQSMMARTPEGCSSVFAQRLLAHARTSTTGVSKVVDNVPDNPARYLEAGNRGLISGLLAVIMVVE
jgi:hypothetical protein